MEFCSFQENIEMRFNMPKKEPEFIIKMKMKETEENLSLQLCRQRHKEIAKEISKVIKKHREKEWGEGKLNNRRLKNEIYKRRQ